MGLYLGYVLYIHLCTIYIFEMAIVSRIQFVLRHMWFVREVINLIQTLYFTVLFYCICPLL